MLRLAALALLIGACRMPRPPSPHALACDALRDELRQQEAA